MPVLSNVPLQTACYAWCHVDTSPFRISIVTSDCRNANVHADMQSLLKYKVTTLNLLSLLCGSPIRSNKQDKSAQILRTLNFYLQLPRGFDLVAIDIGIKNFSYCKIPKFSIESFDLQAPDAFKVLFDTWKTLNLTEKYPRSNEFLDFNLNGSFETNDLLQDKYYLGYLNHKIYHDVVGESKLLSVLLIETQRTKSNNNKVTLPNILDNYHFENLFYSQNLVNSMKGHSAMNLLLPMNSNRMTNFLINRFLIKEDINSKNSKKLRLKLVPYLIDNKLLNIEGSDDSNTLIKSLLALYNFSESKITKLDDLFDSFLYNVSFLLYYYNSLWVNEYIKHDRNLEELVDILNYNQLGILQGLFKAENLTINETFAGLNSQKSLGSIGKVDRKRWVIE